MCNAYSIILKRRSQKDVVPTDPMFKSHIILLLTSLIDFRILRYWYKAMFPLRKRVTLEDRHPDHKPLHARKS